VFAITVYGLLEWWCVKSSGGRGFKNGFISRPSSELPHQFIPLKTRLVESIDNIIYTFFPPLPLRKAVIGGRSRCPLRGKRGICGRRVDVFGACLRYGAECEIFEHFCYSLRWLGGGLLTHRFQILRRWADDYEFYSG